MLYVLNTLTVPLQFNQDEQYAVIFRKISVEYTKQLLDNNRWQSAVGHESTAKLLSQLLQKEIPYCRKQIFMQKGDLGIHFVLKERLPEGKVLSEEELKNLPCDLILSEVIAEI